MAERTVSITLEQKSIIPGSDINGAVTVTYGGRFDGVQVNTYVIGTNEQVHFVNVNGKPISLYARLFVHRNDMGGKKSFAFMARVEHNDLPKQAKIRFRAAIIQEHKEVESDTIFVPVTA